MMSSCRIKINLSSCVVSERVRVLTMVLRYAVLVFPNTCYVVAPNFRDMKLTLTGLSAIMLQGRCTKIQQKTHSLT